MTGYRALADLPLSIDHWRLETTRRDTSAGWERVTTTLRAAGPGDATGAGEDVTYAATHHEGLRVDDLPLPTGEFTFDDFSHGLEDRDLFPRESPERSDFRDYRRWAVESAGLDLALRQAGTSLGAALERTYDPVRFVVSTRLGDPPTTDRVEGLLERDRSLQFKLDPTADWPPGLYDDLAATDAVRILDLKGHYEDTDVETPADPDRYERVCATFPEAIIEDPAVTPETRPVLAPHADRLSWDAPIHGVADLRDRPFEPRWCNVKPSRFGTVRSLLSTIEYCFENDVAPYGGGQFELGVGRSHLHALASCFYPDAPNDVAPRPYNDPDPGGDLPGSPLAPPADPPGLGWTD